MGSYNDYSNLPSGAAKFAAAFNAFYQTKARQLQRRRKDLSVLKLRVGVSNSAVPATTKKYIEGKK